VRLINADALNDEMYHKSFEVDDGRNVWNSGLWIRYKIFEEAIRDAPTVDAVPVVRCRECKYLRLTGTVWRCTNRIVMMICEPNDYCSRGEKSEAVKVC